MSKLRKLHAADLPQLEQLSRSAQWNQTRQDWERTLALAGDGAFGIEEDGAIVASTTVVRYGERLAWVGMVLTLPEHQQKGHASRLLEHGIHWAEKAGVDWIKLDATGQGRPIYEGLGFAAESEIERWRRPAGPLEKSGSMIVHAYVVDPSFDRAYFGAHRLALLNLLRKESAAFVPGFGYAMTRPGVDAAYFGPCVVKNCDTAPTRSLIEWAIEKNAGRDLYWDLFPNNNAALGLALEYGFQPQRKLTRMAKPGRPDVMPLLRNEASVFAIAGFEYG